MCKIAQVAPDHIWVRLLPNTAIGPYPNSLCAVR
jgi:hypothetical protein